MGGAGAEEADDAQHPAGDPGKAKKDVNQIQGSRAWGQESGGCRVAPRIRMAFEG
jgi:hypothetical protein